MFDDAWRPRDRYRGAVAQEVVVPFPADKIEAKQFELVRRGFEPDEVRAYLRAVAGEYRRVTIALADSVAEAEAERERAAESWIARSPIADIGQRVESILTVAAEEAMRIRDDAERRTADDRTEVIALTEAAERNFRKAEEVLAAAALEAAAIQEAAEAEAVQIIATVQDGIERRAADERAAAEAALAALGDSAKEHLRMTKEVLAKATLEASAVREAAAAQAADATALAQVELARAEELVAAAQDEAERLRADASRERPLTTETADEMAQARFEADLLRASAAEDAERLRAEAVTEAKRLRAEAEREVQEMRAEAQADAEWLRATATEDALKILTAGGDAGGLPSAPPAHS